MKDEQRPVVEPVQLREVDLSDLKGINQPADDNSCEDEIEAEL